MNESNGSVDDRAQTTPDFCSPLRYGLGYDFRCAPPAASALAAKRPSRATSGVTLGPAVKQPLARKGVFVRVTERTVQGWSTIKRM